MLKYSEEFMSKKFNGTNMKDAYMKAVKWYATNVLAKNELQEVTCSFEKDKQSPIVTIHLYVTTEEEEVRQAHCQICKEAHASFFISEETNCAWCKIKGYQNRCDQRISVKKQYYKDLLNRRMYDD